MNQLHLHLLINHLPIVGSILGAIVLSYGLWAKSDHTKIAAYILLILSSVGAVIGYFTGEGAEESIENIQSVNKDMIEVHEEFAIIALIAISVLGIISVIGIILTLIKSSFIKPVAFITLIVSLISFGLVARTGYLGGQIRHTEINNASSTDQKESGKEDD